MANTVKLKRSAVASAVPTTAQLELGELAINTNDGKLFLKRNNGTESIVQVGSSLIADNGTGIAVNGRTTFSAPNTSAAAWTTAGINLVVSPATFTDTTSSGTVADIRMNNFGAQTLAASSPITATLFYGTYFNAPIAGTNVTATNRFALGAETLRVTSTSSFGDTLFGAGIQMSGGVVFNTATSSINMGTSQTTGTWTAGGASQTGTITLGQSTVAQTTNIQAGATASGSTKTINIGTGGLTGSTTTVTIGSSNSTTTVGIQGSLTTTGNIAALTGTGRAFLATDSGGSMSLGRVDGVASAPYIDFNSGATLVDYDTRIAASSGTGTAGQGTLTLTSATTALTGVLSTPLGSAAAPSHTFTGDTNTGMWSPAADTIAFSEGGVEAMRIDSTGNVGIGTTSPGYKLSVSGTAEITAAKEGVFTITDGATVNLDPNNGSIQTWTLGANRTPGQANWASGQSITLMIDDGTAFAVTWTTLGVVWETNAGSAPTLATTGFTVIVLWKVGTTIYGARVGDA